MGTGNKATEDLAGELRELIRERQVVVILGSGVSMATSPKSLTWRGLIENGVEWCRKKLRASDAWCRTAMAQLEEKEADLLLGAAHLVHSKLLANGGDFSRWLRETFATLQPENPNLIRTLASWGAPLATTNYDDLIKEVTGLTPITWRDSEKVARWARGLGRYVFHLHGHWDSADSVVLGIRSYEEVKNNDHTQAVMAALPITKSLVFVGCGEEGLNDPNFGHFLEWLTRLEGTARVEHRHYRLVPDNEDFEPIGRLFALPYGGHDDLEDFLKRLTPEPPEPAEPDSKPKPPTIAPSPKLELPESVRYYLRRLTLETKQLSLLGLGRSLQIDLPIDQAYVPLRTTLARSFETRQTDQFQEGRAEHEEPVELADVFRKAQSIDERGVILLGEPGSGKTTGAKQLAWRLASGDCAPEGLGLPPRTIPVLLRFRNLSGETLREKNGLRSFLLQETRCEEAPSGLEAPGPELWDGAGGNLLWILDGLDEVIDSHHRKTVAAWLRKTLAGRTDDRFLVTCRFQGYFEEGVPLGSRFVEFHVRPLDDGQMERFVKDWFGAAYRKLLGPGDQAEARSRADSEELLEILARPAYQTGRIRELCTNPLLLTILCIVFHEERRLPTGRAELYAHCVKVFLEYWRSDLYKSDLGTKLKPYDAEAAQAVLARMAWWMHQEQDRATAPLVDLAGEAEKGLIEVSPKAGLGRDGKSFLDRMRNESGILAMGGEGQSRCGFLHLSFQEFLASDHATRAGLAKELASRIGESWWREVGLLSLRHSASFCEAFFREMLEAGIAENDPDLAARCLEESRYPVVKPFIEVLEGRSKTERVAAVLGLFRDAPEPMPELVAISMRLADSQDAKIRGFAREILYRAGVSGVEDDVLIDDRTGIEFVRIPKGVFKMGSLRGEDLEKPVHEVRISRDFLLGKYPVTNAQYGRFLEAAGTAARKPEYWDNRRFNQPKQPVVGVSWEEAVAFCEWAGGRLPTEAEWEYACRAGTETEYGFGDDEESLGEYAWFSKNSGGQTQPVGTKKPNRWGLHDMHGNIWEWCQDWFTRYREGAQVDARGPDKGVFRVYRGGAWDGPPRPCRSAYRNGFTPSYRNYDLGFRVARSSAGQSGT